MGEEFEAIKRRAFEFREKRKLSAVKVDAYKGVPLVYISVTDDEIERDFTKKESVFAHGVIKCDESHITLGILSLRLDGISYLCFLSRWDRNDMEFLSGLEKKDNIHILRITENRIYGDSFIVYESMRNLKAIIEKHTTFRWTKDAFDNAVLRFMEERGFSRQRVCEECFSYLKGAEDDCEVSYKKVEEVEKTKDEK